MLETIYQKIAKIIPKKLRYFIVIDSWAKSTTGKYSDTIINELTVDKMLKRIEG